MKRIDRIIKIFLEKSYIFGTSTESIMEQLDEYLFDLKEYLTSKVSDFNFEDFNNVSEYINGISRVTSGALKNNDRYLEIARIYFYNILLKNAITEAELEDTEIQDISKDDLLRSLNRLMNILYDESKDIISNLSPDNIKEIEKDTDSLYNGLVNAYRESEYDWILAMTAIIKMRNLHNLVTMK